MAGLGRGVLNTTSQTCGSGWLGAKLRYRTATFCQSLKEVFFVLFLYQRLLYNVIVWGNYDSKSARQCILPVIPCQISYYKSSVKATLSPIVSWKCYVMTSGQLWNLVDKWISNNHMAMCMCLCVHLYQCTNLESLSV